ncbi:MAG: DUF2341 domain-containing protein [Kiritimatiellae bacterium]|nr:DUF2341 domain-containing protein [Kiritimatiellia bacterium]
MRKLLLSASLCALCAAYAHGAFTKRIAFTTSGYGGDAALANFPVLVKLPGTINGFDYADFGGTTNLVFKDSAGNAIPHEVDTWNTSGTSLIWVKVPSVTSTTTFTMYFCGSDNAANTPTAVWTAANYVGVWHMDETSGTVADATGHGLTATPMGAYATSSARYTGNDAPIGHARQTGGNANTKGYLSIPSYDSFNVGNTFTMSGWVRATGLGNAPRLFSRKEGYKDTNGWEIEMTNFSTFKARGANKDSYTGTFAPTFQAKWLHVAFVFNGYDLIVYGNGVPVSSSGTITEATDNDKPLSIGCDSDGTENHIQGAFDECRLLDAVASADWIAAEYATVASDTFVTAGDIEDVGAKPGIAIFVR